MAQRADASAAGVVEIASKHTAPLLLIALMSWRGFDATVAVSFVSSCLSLLVLAWIGLGSFNPWIALAAPRAS